MTRANWVLGLGGLLVGALTAFAIYYAPIAAAKKQRKLDEEREAKELEREMLENSGPDDRSGPPVLPRL
jgi:hypothetical protein